MSTLRVVVATTKQQAARQPPGNGHIPHKFGQTIAFTDKTLPVHSGIKDKDKESPYSPKGNDSSQKQFSK